MKLFECPACGQVLHFENTACLGCGRSVGYLADEDRMAAVDPDGAAWLLAGAGDDTRVRFCRNWELSACNWLVPDQDGDYCAACRHNRIVPDLSDPENHARWQRIEAAKRRLIYTLHHLGLPTPVAGDGHPEPLVFDFLADDPGRRERVLTGHEDGVITIALNEADDAIREKMRSDLGEFYRTLLGHFRHEVGHYYWDILVRDGGRLDEFRAVFGDETVDYAASLRNHYNNGASPAWRAGHVSAYATMHPWEDWAETWAHYLHMIDTLETAASLGLTIGPAVDASGELSAVIDLNPYGIGPVEGLLDAWTPLTVTLNTLNRSMGQRDLYPFALPLPVRDKMAFIHDLMQDLRLQG